MNFYYRLTFLLNLKNPVNTFVRYFMHIFFLLLCGLFCSLLPSCYRRHPSLLTLYINLISQSFFSHRARILVFCFTVSQVSCQVATYSSMSLDPSANILSSLYLIRRRVLFMKCILSLSWDGWMDGWMACTVCFFLTRDVFTTCPFLNNWSNMSFGTEVFLYTSNQL